MKKMIKFAYNFQFKVLKNSEKKMKIYTVNGNLFHIHFLVYITTVATTKNGQLAISESSRRLGLVACLEGQK